MESSWEREAGAVNPAEEEAPAAPEPEPERAASWEERVDMDMMDDFFFARFGFLFGF